MSAHLLMFNFATFHRRMLNSSVFNLRMPSFKPAARPAFFASLLGLLSVAFVAPAHAQTFTLTIPGLFRAAIQPSDSDVGTITLASVGGFNSPVALSCQLTQDQPNDPSPPFCEPPSPQSVTPPGSASVTITTTSTTAVGGYTFLITGTGGGITQTASVSMTVQNAAEDYSLLISPTTATPGSIPAGSVATTTVTVSPIGTYSTHNPPHTVTFSCLSVTPTVTLAPVCTFNPSFVTVSPSQQLTSTLTITTTGPTPTTRLWSPRMFYAFWLALPGLGLVGLATTGVRRKSVLGALLLMLIAAGLLMLPACGSTTTVGTNGNTPANTYTFTITGADETGAAPSTTTPSTVTLTVTNPPS